MAQHCHSDSSPALGDGIRDARVEAVLRSRAGSARLACVGDGMTLGRAAGTPRPAGAVGMLRFTGTLKLSGVIENPSTIGGAGKPRLSGFGKQSVGGGLKYGRDEEPSPSGAWQPGSEGGVQQAAPEASGFIAAALRKEHAIICEQRETH